jgi:hypothetical protein
MYKYFILLIVVISSCSNKHKADYEVQAELRMIDTLHTRLETVRGWLDKLPLEEMKERKDIIKHNYEFCDLQYKEKKLVVDEETSRLMDEYKGYGKIYSRVVDSYKPIVTEMEELYIQLKTLKESAYSKDYQKETFLTYFEKEKEDVLKLYKFAETVLKPAVEVDLGFERAQKRVEALAESLKTEESL